jgi:hypothetical protein
MVLTLASLMEDGKKIKSGVDYCIDHCGLVHNIRETILSIWQQIDTSRTTLDTQALLSSGANYLARYAQLIVLNDFLREQAPTLEVTFSEWTARHGEFCTSFSNRDIQYLSQRSDTAVKNIISHPERALSLHLETLNTAHEPFIKYRKGNVLGPGSIIKRDVFHGLHKNNTEVIGAPNFRKATNRDIFACAAPTAEGIVNAITYVSAISKNSKSGQQCINNASQNTRKNHLDKSSRRASVLH